MIRALAAAALPMFGLGLGVVLVGPDLLSAPRGEPLMVTGSGSGMVKPVSRDGEACADALLLAAPLGEEATDRPVGRILALRLGAANGPVAMQEIPVADEAGGSTIVLVFDEVGRLLAAGEPVAAQLDDAQAALMEECAVAHAEEVGLI